MLKIKEINNQETWDNYISNNNGHPLQLWGWGEVKTQSISGETNWEVKRIAAIDESSNAQIILGAAQILFRKAPSPLGKLAYIPRGPVVAKTSPNFENIFSLFKQYAKEQGSFTLKIEPDWKEIPEQLNKLNFTQSSTNIFISNTLALNTSDPKWYSLENKSNSISRLNQKNKAKPTTGTITGTLDYIEAQHKEIENNLLTLMSRSTRQNVRKAAKNVIIDKVHFGEPKFQIYFEQFYQIYSDTSARASFPIHNKDYYLNLAKQMGNYLDFWVAKNNEEENEPQSVVSFLWNIKTKHCSFELYGGMNEKGQKLRANYPLKWNAIKDAIYSDTNFYDMNGLVSDGVSSFKLGFVGNDQSKSTEWVGTIDFPIKKITRLAFDTFLPKIKNFIRKTNR
ncbi:MAG: peptidoglycan bridge formation glycyltransferase FemA/FemB family protein [Candidatus Ancillula sp.]|jgi:lipid II:glycine glycyltransferase (peptidoglycan interpeptide bridge formation enzyme)|nr:peptidoglycan bridge formation glycyltransferase FemA/FemB family protein [Candidatus Ancillula sp.]